MARMSESAHLKQLLGLRSGTVDAQIVCLDIVNYSKRKSTIQKRVVERFQADLKASITAIASSNMEFIQQNNLNLSTDTITVPTGDGAISAFTFGGIQTFALDFARNFLERNLAGLQNEKCEVFSEHQWCNCHDLYAVRIGINEGKTIIFEDMNGNINVAGTVVNMASRVMSLGDAAHILMTPNAYGNLIDMSPDNALDQKMKALGKVRAKHGEQIEVYQYVGDDELYVSADVPIAVELEQQMASNLSRMGVPQISMDGASKAKMLEMSKMMGGVTDQLLAMLGQSEAGQKKLD